MRQNWLSNRIFKSFDDIDCCFAWDRRHWYRSVAEAQVDLRRVRYARYQFLFRALAGPYFRARENTLKKVALLRFLLQKNAPDLPVENLVAFLNSTPQGPHKFATILSQEAKQLLAIDRYERRVLSRRKSAIRAFDETCRRPTDCNNMTNNLKFKKLIV